MLFQKSSNLHKLDELMEYDQKMDMHVRHYELQPQNINICTCMQQLCYNSTSKPCFGSKLHQYDMNHARINSKHEQEDNGATLSLVVQEGSSICNHFNNFFNYQAILQAKLR